MGAFRCFVKSPSTHRRRSDKLTHHVILTGRLDSLPTYSLTTAMNLSDLSATQLRRAASIKERIEKLHKELAWISTEHSSPKFWDR